MNQELVIFQPLEKVRESDGQTIETTAFSLWSNDIMKKISKYIFPNFGVRVRKDDVPGFPECQNIAKLYQIEKADLQNKNPAILKKKLGEQS